MNADPGVYVRIPKLSPQNRAREQADTADRFGVNSVALLRRTS
jgi:hypothetical protein